MKITKIIALLTVIGTAVVLCSCTPKQSKLSFEAMDTFMSVQTTDEEVSEKIKTEVEELDSLLSVTDENSEVYRLNQSGSAEVSDRTLDIINKSLDLCRETGGTLDISVYPIVREWGFTTGNYRVPKKNRLAELLQKVDYSKIKAENGRVSLENGMKIDLGAVAKGYVADRAVEICEDNGVDSALLNLGGTVAAVGKKRDGSKWKVGIENPDDADYFGYVECSDRVVATSGGYERYFEGEDGKVYRHIIDPKTGYPTDNGIVSVSVVSDSGIKSDALSTALFVMGLDGATDFYREQGDFDFIILTTSNEIYVTGGIYDSFKNNSECKVIKV